MLKMTSIYWKIEDDLNKYENGRQQQSKVMEDDINILANGKQSVVEMDLKSLKVTKVPKVFSFSPSVVFSENFCSTK
jgi:hypothetical protein